MNSLLLPLVGLAFRYFHVHKRARHMKSDCQLRVFPSFPWLLLICASLCACSATGSIRDNFYHPADQSISKLPLKVALLVNDATKSQKFEITVKHYFTVVAHPGLTNAVKAELATLFAEVTVIDRIAQVKDQDIIATVHFDVHSETSEYEWKIRSQIKASFKDARTGFLVTDYHDEDKSPIMTAKYPHSFFGFLLSLTIILSPIAFQMQADSWVEPVLGDVEERLVKLIQGMSEALQSDRHLNAHASNLRN